MKDKTVPLRHVPVYTRNTQLASALSALGIPFEAPYWSKIEEDGKTTVTWHFQDTSKCGKYKTKELIDAWYNDDWYKENYPKSHPFALLICALNTKEYLVDQIKQSKGHVVIQKGTKKFIVTEDSQMHKKLKARHGN